MANKPTDFFEKMAGSFVTTKEIASVAQECGGTSRKDSEAVVEWLVRNGGKKGFIIWGKTGHFTRAVYGFFLKRADLMDREQLYHVGYGYLFRPLAKFDERK
jgi:hypothetical protein